MSRLRQLTFTVLATLAIALGVIAVPFATSYAAGGDEVTKGFNAAGGSSRCRGGKCSLSDAIETITNVLLFIIGAISVIMIIIGGIRYVIANGDSSQITSAKNTVMYSVIGLVVALLAYAIINFVINQFT